MNNLVKLTKENFLLQIIEYGFFHETIPNCFSTKKILENIEIFSASKSYITSALEFYIPKNDITKRKISIPNIVSFYNTAIFLHNNFDLVFELLNSENSLSPITYIHNGYKSTEREDIINCANIREEKKSKSDFVKSIEKSIAKANGNLYVLYIDIEKFYDSIYTHALSWVICGKNKAKEMLNNSKSRDKYYTFADNFDKYIRNMKRNETNGIITGPFTSRIFSEMFLSQIDTKLRDRYCFTRYVDDYKFYFNNKFDCEFALQKIQTIFDEYNIKINESKTLVKKFPFDMIGNIEHELECILERFDQEISNKCLFTLLDYCSLKYDQGEKSCFKYMFKKICECKLIEYLGNFLILYIIQILKLLPTDAKVITNFLKQNISFIKVDQFEKILNDELKKCEKIKNNIDSLNIIFLIRELNLNLDYENLVKICFSSYDFLIIIGLDLLKMHRINEFNIEDFKKVENELLELLTKKIFSTDRWLLKIEIIQHQLIKVDSFKDCINVEDNEIFKLIITNKISFYESIRDIKDAENMYNEFDELFKEIEL